MCFGYSAYLSDGDVLYSAKGGLLKSSTCMNIISKEMKGYR